MPGWAFGILPCLTPFTPIGAWPTRQGISVRVADALSISDVEVQGTQECNPAG